MVLTQILSLSHRSSLLHRIGEELEAKQKVWLTGLAGSGKSLSVSFLAGQVSRPILVVTGGTEEAERIRDDLEGFLGAEMVGYFPPWGILPYEENSPHADLVGMRLEALSGLLLGRHVVVVTTPRALMTRVLPPEALRTALVELRVGQTVDFEGLLSDLVNLGFERRSMVTEMGELSVRGGIVDIFSFGHQNPVRVEFFGDQIESIREFDVYTQRSIGRREAVKILPAREVIFNPDRIDRVMEWIRTFGDFSDNGVDELIRRMEQGPFFEGMEQYGPLLQPDMVTILDYLPAEASVFLDEPEVLEEEAQKFWAKVEEAYQRAKAKGRVAVPPLSLYEFWDGLEPKMNQFPLLYSSLFSMPGTERVDLGMKAQETFHGSLDILRGRIGYLKDEGYRIFVLCDNQGQAERLEELLEDHLDRLTVGVGGIHGGFVFPNGKLAVFTDHEIFGRYRWRRRLRRFRTGVPIRDFEALRVGDYVVHVDYGIGRYLGPERIPVEGKQRDCLAIAYQGGDKLYVPVEQLGRVQKYTGQEGKPPVLSKLGNMAWERTKSQAKRAIRDMAGELLEIHGVRKVMRGFASSPDTEWQRELEASFIYEETPDQLSATAEIKKDMENQMPMDRLVCGDVGYGKTEVAIRAAFKAIMDGKQVAVLVPTTVLAQQHLNTFRERLANYPVNVAMLSRFKTRKEQKVIIEGLKRGTVDIVIGTHRLIQKDVQFKDLELVIIDEEQRFGVAHKEKLKHLRKLVDVLTLTATPIPRTLHLSLMGARDLSTINTPPKDRLPIHTEIVRFNQNLIAEAILREMNRGGQVYFVHNRVQSIEAMAKFLRRLAPQVNFAIAHGQMPERELERVMLDFLDKKYDCLVSTMIIESGLDIPNVNTVIINRADKLGLSQLYQLRGRVGRSNRRAYAYLLVPPWEVLSDTARKKLKAIEEFSDLGSGFRLAMRDLEIRGAGNILGPEQHGFITAVGFDLYCQLLEETISELKGEKIPRALEPELDIKVDAYIPDEYIPDCEQKILAYQRLVRIRELAEVEQMEEELRDRFGQIPRPTRSLLDIVSIKALARRLGASAVTIEDGRLILEYPEERGFSPQELASLIDRSSAPLEFISQMNLGIKVELTGENQEERVAFAKEVLQGLL